MLGRPVPGEAPSLRGRWIALGATRRPAGVRWACAVGLSGVPRAARTRNLRNSQTRQSIIIDETRNYFVDKACRAKDVWL